MKQNKVFFKEDECVNEKSNSCDNSGTYFQMKSFFLSQICIIMLNNCVEIEIITKLSIVNSHKLHSFSDGILSMNPTSITSNDKNYDPTVTIKSENDVILLVGKRNGTLLYGNMHRIGKNPLSMITHDITKT